MAGGAVVAADLVARWCAVPGVQVDVAPRADGGASWQLRVDGVPYALEAGPRTSLAAIDVAISESVRRIRGRR